MNAWSHHKTSRSTARTDLIVISVVAGVVLMVSAWFDIFERFAAWSGRYNRWQVNEVVSVLVFLSAALAIFSWRRWRELKLEMGRHQEYRNLFRLANDPILIFDVAEATVLDVNDRACEVYGIARENFIGRKLDDITPDSAGARRRMELVRKEGKVEDFEVVHLAGDGRPIHFLINRTLIEYQGRQAVLSIERDITERKRAEEAAQQAELKYRDIFANAEEGIFQSTPVGQYIAANPALARMHGFDSPEDLIRNRKDISREVYVDAARREEFKRLLNEHGAIRGFEHQLLRKDGSTIWVSVNARAVCDRDGAIKYYEGTAQDITDRKRAEAALRESEERYRDLVENSRDLICTHDLNGLILSANRAAIELLGYAPQNYVGIKHMRDILAPEVRHGFDDYLARIRKDGVASGTMLVQTSSGERRIWEYHNTLRTEGVPNPIVRGMAHDITDRRRAQEALRESEERYRELFDNAKDAIYVHDLSGRYVSLNRAAEKLSGYPREEIIGKHFSNFVAPSHLKYVRKNLCSKLDESGETTYEVDIITRDRRRVPVEIVSRLIYENGVPVGIQGTARDITERRRAQDALRTYSQRLIEVQEGERQNIARELHDEIGQVLTAVKINLQTVQKSYRKAEFLPRLEESMSIVDEALARVRELSLDLRPSLLDDLGLAAALRWYVDRYAQRTGITAEMINGFEENGRLPRELETACFRIAQEALTNVARHAKASSVTVELQRGSEKVLLTISDDGVGFDASNLVGYVSSLGLRGMRERARAASGDIDIDSTPNGGTRVFASFPLNRKK